VSSDVAVIVISVGAAYMRLMSSVLVGARAVRYVEPPATKRRTSSQR
jgi:hypothetical protein